MGGGLTTAEHIERWERLIEEGEPDTVTREFLREIGGYDDEAIDRLAGTPLWEARRRIVPTRPARAASRAGAPLRRPCLFGEVEAPALLLVGSESPAWAERSVDAHAETPSRTPRSACSRARDTART